MLNLKRMKRGFNDPKLAIAYLILGEKRFQILFHEHMCNWVKDTKTSHPTFKEHLEHKPLTLLETFMTKRCNEDGFADIHEHLTTLNMLTVELNLKNILELGTRIGTSTLGFLEAAKKINGKVTSIDIDPCLEAKKLVKEQQLEKYWTFIQSDDLKVEWHEPIDHLFIDTDHSYEHVLAELKKYEPFVRPEGLITMHDIVFWPSVLDAIEKYLENRSDLTFYKYFNCYGLGVIRKHAK